MFICRTIEPLWFEAVGNMRHYALYLITRNIIPFNCIKHHHAPNRIWLKFDNSHNFYFVEDNRYHLIIDDNDIKQKYNNNKYVPKYYQVPTLLLNLIPSYKLIQYYGMSIPLIKEYTNQRNGQKYKFITISDSPKPSTTESKPSTTESKPKHYNQTDDILSPLTKIVKIQDPYNDLMDYPLSGSDDSDVSIDDDLDDDLNDGFDNLYEPYDPDDNKSDSSLDDLLEYLDDIKKNKKSIDSIFIDPNILEFFLFMVELEGILVSN